MRMKKSFIDTFLFFSDCPDNKLKNVSVGKSEAMPFSKGALIWSDKKYALTYIPVYLRVGFFIKQCHKGINKGENISITVTGSVKVFVAIEEENERSGGYEKSLPDNGWKRELETIKANYLKEDISLTRIFSKSENKEPKILLPPTTTGETTMLIIVVSTCQGKTFIMYRSQLC